MPLPKMDIAIRNAMGLISEFCDMDRIAIYRYDFEQKIATQLYAVDKPECDKVNTLKVVPFSAIRSALQCHKAGKEYIRIRIEELAENNEFRNLIEELGCTSVFASPLTEQGELWGTFVMTSIGRQNELSQMDVAIVKIFCEMIINVLQRIERERALEEAYESNRLILDSINDGMGLYNRDGIALNVNRHLAQRFHASVEDIIGTGMEYYFPQGNNGSLFESWIQRLRSVFDTGVPDSFMDEWGGMTLSNRFFPVYKSGKVEAVAMFSTDVTDSIKALEEALKNALLQREAELLREKELEYLEILDAAVDGAWIRDFCTDVITFSDKWIKQRGLEDVDAEDMEARGLDLIHPEDVNVFRLAQEECLKYRRPMYQYEHRTIMLNGRYEWILGRVKVIYDENGNPTRLYGACMNINDRKHMEESLRRSETLLRNIIEGARNPIFLMDMQSRMVLCNTALATLFGKTVADIIGKTAISYMGNPKKAKAVMENDRQMLDAGIPMTFEESIQTMYGDRVFLAEKTPWKDTQGNTIGLIGISQDITEQKNIEAELRLTTQDLTKKNKLITDFIANISHELKTPLTIILMQMELMRLCLDDPQNLTGMIDAATQNAIRLSRLVGNILDLSRADAGYLEKRLDSVDIVGHIRDICESVRIYAQSKSIELIFESKRSRKIMLIDVEKVERILLNLLSNAIKFTPAGGRIRVCSTFRRRGDLILMVQDTGVGISTEKQKTIFDRFVQVDTSLSRENEGCGIGLALVKSFVEILGGNISVYSELGKGSIFLVELPSLEVDSSQKQYEVIMPNMKNRVEMELSDLLI